MRRQLRSPFRGIPAGAPADVRWPKVSTHCSCARVRALCERRPKRGQGMSKAERTRWRWGRRRGLIAGAVIAAGSAFPLMGLTALGSSVGSAAFSGGAGTVSVGGTLYAKNGGALTLTVAPRRDTKCVDVTGAFAGRQTSARQSRAGRSRSPPERQWRANRHRRCIAELQRQQLHRPDQTPSASFVLDNTGPVVTGTVSPQPNAAGWNNSNAGITWSATDAGSGVASGPTPATDTQTRTPPARRRSPAPPTDSATGHRLGHRQARQSRADDHWQP